MESEEKFRVVRGLDEKEGLPKNVVLIETPQAKFRIAYGYHVSEQNPADVEMSEAIALETGGESYATPEEAEETFRRAVDSIQYRKIITQAKEKKKPIFFVDMTNDNYVPLLQMGLKTGETLLGIKLLGSLAREVKEETGDMTRREFLKKSMKGAAGLYFSSHALGYLSSLAKIGSEEKSAIRAVNRFLNDIDERVHPETQAIILTLRNYLMAQKMKTVAEQFFQKDKKADVAMIVGSGHSGIEKALQKDDPERIEVIHKLLKTPGLSKARKQIATIARFDFDDANNKWKTTLFEDPRLTSIKQK